MRSRIARATASGAPSPRRRTAGVWTGSSFLVWGGETFPGYGSDGGFYDPVADLWSSISTTGAPSGRYDMSVTWTGSETVVWGGDPVGAAQSTGGIYNPRTLCGVGGCQQVGLTYCSSATIGFQCTPGVPFTETCDNIDNDCDGFIDDNIPASSAACP